MCEKEPKRRSCTECPQYDGMVCSATNMVMGPRGLILQEEHRRGFICLDTGEAELKGDAVFQWTAEQERLCQEKGYKSCEEMWAAEGKQVKSGFLIDKDNEHMEPTLQVSSAKSVDDTMYHPNQPENQKWYTAEARANIGVDLDLLREHNPNIKVVRASDLEAGSPSSECPSLREGPPQKGKIAENKAVHNSQRLSVTLSSDATCGNCKKSHTEGGRLVCDRWGLHDILMPYRPCEKWALDPIKIKRQNEAPSLYKEGVSPEPKAGDLVIVPGSSICTADNASLPPGRIIADSGLTYVENPPPLFRDLNGFWEPVRPRSCTNCKLYNDPICMKMATHIGTRQEILVKEEENGFLCFAADQMQRDE